MKDRKNINKNKSIDFLQNNIILWSNNNSLELKNKIKQLQKKLKALK